MIWDNNVSIENFLSKVKKWHSNGELCDCPIDAQYALDLIFKTLIDDKENYPYLTTMPESIEQTNCIMLNLILKKYSKDYRKLLRKNNKCKI